MPITMYHNPKCSKSRQTLSLLEHHQIQPKIIEYLKNPPSITEMQNILHLLKCSARDLMRKKDHLYKELSLDNPALNEIQLITAMLENPQLIERPIVITGSKAVIGRPPEKVLEII